jgi:hypothetical protein
MATTRFADHLLIGVHASRPAASAVPAGSLYSCTTHNKIYQSDGATTWSDYVVSLVGPTGPTGPTGATGATGATGPAGTSSISTDGLWDAKGDLAAASGPDAAARLALGSNNQVLTADSAQTLGIKWATPATVPTTLDSLTDVSVASPTDTYVLTWDAGASSWVAKAVGLVDVKTVEVKVVDDATVLTTGEGKLIFCVPAAFNGRNLATAHAFVTTVSSSGLPSVGIRNVTDSVEMLSTNITIDASEFTSYTAAAAAVIDTAHDDVATGDLIAVDIDTAGTGAKGLGVILGFTF